MPSFRMRVVSAAVVTCLFMFTVVSLLYPRWLSNQQHLSELFETLNDISIQSEGTLQEWIDKEYDVALYRLLANIAPGGENVEDAIDGAVIASPSKRHPDYYFQWTRDSAITLHSLLRLYERDPAGPLAARILRIFKSYVPLQEQLQHTSNPSGDFSNLQGLGEPKFNADGTAFTGDWGRPQRDGPALRALLLSKFISAYNETHPGTWQSGETDFYKRLYSPTMPASSVIKADLEYVSHHMFTPSFDIWEEINGMHYFTSAVSALALRRGAQIASLFGDDGASQFYYERAEEMDRFLRNFYTDDPTRGPHLTSTLQTDRTGLDCGNLLGALHGTQADVGSGNPFPPWSDAVLTHLLHFSRDQRDRFPINRAHNERSADGLPAAALGRYPEDIYDGDGMTTGNPWFLCTSSAAEILYRTAVHYWEEGCIHISTNALPFWTALNASLSEPIRIPRQDAAFAPALALLVDKADGFLRVLRKFAGPDGEQSEQIDGRTGYLRGARNLTWSYGAFIEAVSWRKEALRVV